MRPYFLDLAIHLAQISIAPSIASLPIYKIMPHAAVRKKSRLHFRGRCDEERGVRKIFAGRNIRVAGNGTWTKPCPSFYRGRTPFPRTAQKRAKVQYWSLVYPRALLLLATRRPHIRTTDVTARRLHAEKQQHANMRCIWSHSVLHTPLLLLCPGYCTVRKTNLG